MNYSENLLSMRQKIIAIFKNYEYAIIPVLKFITIFACINILQNIIGYNGKLSGFVTVAILSLIGTVVSAQTIILGTIVFISFCILSMDLIMGVITFISLIVLYIAFMRFFPKESIYTIMTIIAFSFNMPIVVPFVAAVVSGYASIVAIILGVVIWFVSLGAIPLISNVPVDLSQITQWAVNLQELNLEALLLDRKMLIVIVVFFIVFSVIYIIRRQSIEHSGYIAIGIGLVVNILGFGMAKLFFDDFRLSIFNIVIWSILAAVISVVIQFLSVVLDYQRVENVQFEDEDNYYYVKVVPKINIVSKKTPVKHTYTNSQNDIKANRIYLESNKTTIE